MAAYAELHCLSNFTFLRGASHPEELTERADKLGYSALAITDECSLAGVVRAHAAAKPLGIKLIVGSEIQLADGPKLVLLAQNREGYGNLSQLVSLGRRRANKGGYRLEMADLEPGLADCLALLIPAADSVGCALRTLTALDGAQCAPYDDARWLAERFPGRAWIAAELLLEQDPAVQLDQLRRLSQASGLPLAAAGDVHMHVRRRKILQDTLSAVRHKTTLAQAATPCSATPNATYAAAANWRGSIRRNCWRKP
ncbi:PHP domain-containing protein [Methylogaea oryzae]|uniref:PHP domain-containing protein n=1 Tax=Methylogaea oryzae TaxID=1295382 RepID=UPI0006D2C497|nr:PHP domain-containing protein [Methylogaea oryzae]